MTLCIVNMNIVVPTKNFLGIKICHTKVSYYNTNSQIYGATLVSNFMPWLYYNVWNSGTVHRTMSKHSCLMCGAFSRRSLANCPTEDTLDDNPEDLRVSLMKHQRRALAWMRWRETQTPSAGILGKTPNILNIISYTL